MREVLMSVGIDIGTSTTQLVFSQLEIENLAGAASVPRVQIVSKQVVYRSAIYFTPLLPEDRIDGEKVREIVAAEYQKAGIKPEDLSVGAVIITGETARKENAEAVLQSLSGYAGNFVVATAGSDLEGIIAGRGAGAAKLSKELSRCIANFDIGGGTTNVALFRDGEVEDTSCLDIGGRLVRVHPETRHIEYITPKIRDLIASMGLGIKEGHIANLDDLCRLTERMAAFLDELMGLVPASEHLARMITSRPFLERRIPDGVMFSGGVADAVYADDSGSDVFRYGDLGILLGQAIRGTKVFKEIPVYKPLETIRATVVGAGSHIVDVSGSTISYSEDVFPLKNLPILKMNREDEADSFSLLGERLAQKLLWFKDGEGYQQVAIGIKGVRAPCFDEVKKISGQILQGVSDALPHWERLIILVEEDMAKALGHSLLKDLGYAKEVISLDSVKVENGDYIDIGRPVGQGRVVPVVVKTLVFGG